MWKFIIAIITVIGAALWVANQLTKANEPQEDEHQNQDNWGAR